jgi:hypothetical protein
MKPCKRLERVLVTLSPSLTRGNTGGFQMATAKVALLSTRAQSSPTHSNPASYKPKYIVRETLGSGFRGAEQTNTQPSENK